MNNYAIFNYNHSSEIVKTDLYESWICHIEKGKAKVVFEQTEYNWLRIRFFSFRKEPLSKYCRRRAICRWKSLSSKRR